MAFDSKKSAAVNSSLVKNELLVNNVNIDDLDVVNDVCKIKLLRIPVQINRTKALALLDSGACSSFISGNTFAKLQPGEVRQIKHKQLTFKNAAGYAVKRSL